jgi:hypothetical protein
MSVFSILGKIILCLVVVGVIIGGSVVYLLYTYINPQIEKLSTLDQINYELEERGESKISYNILNGEVSRE